MNKSSCKYYRKYHRERIRLMHAYPHYPERKTISLDGIWDFTFLNTSEPLAALQISRIQNLSFDSLMAVPGVFDTALGCEGRRGIAVYRKILSDFTKGNFRLKINGMGLIGRIFVNGSEIGKYPSPYSHREYFFGPFDPEKQNVMEIIILVDNRFSSEAAPFFLPEFDFYAYGGIYRSIELQQIPESCFLDRVQIRTVDLETGTVKLRILLGGERIPQSIEFKVAFDEGESSLLRAEVSHGVAEAELRVPDFKIWSPESPNLHLARVSIPGDSIMERFGIRTVKAERQEILLNGKPVRLLGVNRHESHPELGPVQNEHLVLEDLKALKLLGANFIRCVHYPQDQAFLDLCDQMGFLVWHESIGWGLEADAIEQHLDAFVEDSRIMTRVSINNPSVIIIAFLNEGHSEKEKAVPCYRKIADAMREEDPSRLVSFASCHLDNDLCLEFADVISFNMYPGWIWPAGQDTAGAQIAPFMKEKTAWVNAQEALRDKPLIISEIGACALYGFHDRNLAPWSEEFQADYMLAACQAAASEERIKGIVLWQMFDTKTFIRGPVRGKARGFNCAGLLDEYRRPKLAFDVVKEEFQKQSQAFPALPAR